MSAARRPGGSATDVRSADVLLAGAGLANSLIALRLKALRPELRVVAFDPRPPGERDAHTWSFFTTDVAPAVLAWLEPLAAHRWDDYEVRFPRYARKLRAPYAAVTGPGLQATVQATLGDDLKLGMRVSALSPDSLTLSDGQTWRAPSRHRLGVARGPATPCRWPGRSSWGWRSSPKPRMG